jgi:hypothetical protein
MNSDWEKFEHAAEVVVRDLRLELGIERVEGKQKVLGASGSYWELDARAWIDGGRGFLIVEARRHTANGLSQESVIAIHGRTIEVGADGAIIVSPMPLQKGAELVARHYGIEHIKLDESSTAETYMAEYMGRTFYGLTVQAGALAIEGSSAVVIVSAGVSESAAADDSQTSK